jgi:diguanylate cyclase (GGDEF)-like protein
MAATVERAAPDHHHVVVAVDLDRFKLVNDTWGHAVGDQVLVDIARLLDDVVRRWQERVPGTTGAVIRMGGDEFLLTLHTPCPIDQDAVRADLDRIRTTTIVAAGQQVELRFSMGLAAAQGACSLLELVSKADLAAYEEKAERARALSQTPSTGPTWSVRQPV